jgi:hypothetical protein
MEGQNTSNIFSGLMDTSDTKNVLILILAVIIIFSLFGVNIVILIGNIIQTLLELVMPVIRQIFGIVGVSGGVLINNTADVVSDTAKFGIDVAEGTVQSVGSLLQRAGEQTLNPNNTLNLQQISTPSTSYTNPIMKTPTSKKVGWCLVGEYEGRRGCIEISDYDKCLSGQVFPSQEICMNPTMTPNMPPQQAPQIPTQ